MTSQSYESERIVTIEDAAELQLSQEHVVTLESRPPNIEGRGAIPIRELVRNSLRMRPDRIIVGEVRGAEALDMLQAMNTGHDGSLTTLHANTPRDALSRIETMVLMAGFDLPIRAIRQQVASALDLIVHLERLQDGVEDREGLLGGQAAALAQGAHGLEADHVERLHRVMVGDRGGRPDVVVVRADRDELSAQVDVLLAEINAEQPALMILDIWLKDSRMDGIDILKTVKRDNPDIPIIIISGHGNVEIAVAAIKHRAEVAVVER